MKYDSYLLNDNKTELIGEHFCKWDYNLYQNITRVKKKKNTIKKKKWENLSKYIKKYIEYENIRTPFKCGAKMLRFLHSEFVFMSLFWMDFNFFHCLLRLFFTFYLSFVWVIDLWPCWGTNLQS